MSYLRDSLGVHNFLYGFSPDNKFNNEKEFLERYPGDEWVDLVEPNPASGHAKV